MHKQYARSVTRYCQEAAT